MFYSGLFSSESNNKIWRVKFLFPHKTILLIVRFDDTPPPKQTFFLVGSSLILFLNKTKKRLATRQYAVGGANTLQYAFCRFFFIFFSVTSSVFSVLSIAMPLRWELRLFT